jgi:transcription elongation factor Elf1
MTTETVTDNKDALRECPFCGNEPTECRDVDKKIGEWDLIQCDICGFNILRKSWNTRTTDTQLAALQGTIESQKQTHDALLKKLGLAVKALRQVLNRAKVHDHEGYEEIAQTALKQLGITL